MATTLLAPSHTSSILTFDVAACAEEKERKDRKRWNLKLANRCRRHRSVSEFDGV